jgi:hypothetical protein
VAETFTCAICGHDFPKMRSDEEAEEELNLLHPGVAVGDCEVVCDDCYKEVVNYQ